MNGQRVFVKGDNENGFSDLTTSESKYTNFVMTGKIKASGSVMSLIDDGEGTLDTIPIAGCFAGLFNECSSLLTPPELPATTLAGGCYGCN